MPKIVPQIESWFDYPDDPMGGRVLVAHIKDGELARILERTTETKTVYVKEFRRPESTIRHVDSTTEIIVAAVKGWEKFYGEDDKPLPCTPENVRVFCKEDGFIRFVSQCREKLAQIALDKVAAEQKN
jgi:hypothetical protein